MLELLPVGNGSIISSSDAHRLCERPEVLPWHFVNVQVGFVVLVNVGAFVQSSSYVVEGAEQQAYGTLWFLLTLPLVSAWHAWWRSRLRGSYVVIFVERARVVLALVYAEDALHVVVDLGVFCSHSPYHGNTSGEYLDF